MTSFLGLCVYTYLQDLVSIYICIKQPIGTHTNDVIMTSLSHLQVRIRVTVQTSRDPPQFASSEWSDFIQVHGITTLPTTPTPALTDGVSVAPRGLTTTGLLLLVIFLCLVAILLVVVVTAGIVCVVCCLKK